MIFSSFVFLVLIWLLVKRTRRHERNRKKNSGQLGPIQRKYAGDSIDATKAATEEEEMNMKKTERKSTSHITENALTAD